MNLLLTGAAGFVGRYVLTRLQDQGYNVVAVYRKKPAPSLLSKAGCVSKVTPVTVDMSPKTDWSGIMSGIDAVIHTGDGLRAFEGVKQMPDKNVSGRAVETTMVLARAAQKAGVKTFVYLSSIKAASGYCADHVLDENDAPAQNRPFYGLLKAEIEGLLAALEQETFKGDGRTMRAVSVRSPIVYGSGGIGNFGRLLALADTPFPLPFANMTNRRSIVAVDNLADGLVRAAENPNGCSGHYFIHDAAPMTMSELMAHLRKSLGRNRRLFPVPKTLVGLGNMLPAAEPIISRLCGDLEFDSTKFETDFSWQAPVPMREALSDMVRAYVHSQKERGLV